MGRKSVVKERKSQILDAFEQCIIRYGLHASSLPKVARAAGLQLSGIHHFIGNREDLVREMVDRHALRYAEEVEAFFDDNPQSPENFLDFLFESSEDDRDEQLIFDDLFNASLRDPAISDILNKTFSHFIERFSTRIQDANPAIPQAKCRECAQVILSLWQGHLTMVSIGIGPDALPDSAKEAAKKLLKALLSP